MKQTCSTFVLAVLLAASPALTARDDSLGLHEDYYLGFSQGVYYGLMLAGADYETAWCVKAELAYEAEGMGAGGEFQAKLDEIYRNCGDNE